MEIRAANKNDIVHIQKLVLALADSYLNDPYSVIPEWLAETLTQEQFAARIASSHYINLVSVLNDQLVGYISIKDRVHLYHLFVSAQYQGRGIARALWERVSDQSASTEYRVRSSLYAVPVYKRFGFVETGPIAEKDGVCFQPMVLEVNVGSQPPISVTEKT